MTVKESKHRRGDPGFRRASIAMFAAGVSTFALLYATQPLMPLLSHDFRVSAAESTLTLALSTIMIAVGLLPAGWLADSWGRARVMQLSLFSSSALGLVTAAAPSFEVLLAIRALEGLALAGVPAVAMTYLTEEIHPQSLGSSIGLYIGGNAIGGMAGRLIAGALAEHGSWRLALLVIGALSFVCALGFARLVPASRHHQRRRFEGRRALASLSVHLHDAGQVRLDLIAALLMGTFVAIYNAIAFRLQAPPYRLGQTATAAIFLVYPIGSLASATAGRAADRFGRPRVLPAAVAIALSGVALTALHPLALLVIGVAVLTAGFFASHSIASSWVGRRARSDPAQAAALYLLAYYTGSSVGGPLGGAAWEAGGWTDVMTFGGLLLAAALFIALRLRAVPPLATTTPSGARPQSTLPAGVAT